MRAPSLSVFVSAAALALAPPAAVAQNLLADPGFETGPVLTGFPTQFGVWAADGGTTPGAENGIAPREGVRMLRFGGTTPTGGAGGGSADVGQLIDLAPFSAEIAAGGARVRASAWFNRIAGDAQTDTQFNVSMNVYATTLSGYVANPMQTPAANASDTVFSDDDVATWERVETEIVLPIDAMVMTVTVSAREDVFNDSSLPELDGHYADDVFAEFIAGCEADLDGDGDADVFDLLAYLDLWFMLDAAAERTGDSPAMIDVFDLLAYLDGWFGGC